MGMKLLTENLAYKVLQVSLAAGEEMSRHFATSEAFIIVEKGEAVVLFTDQEVQLQAGSTLAIPATKPHTLVVKQDFRANVILAGGSKIMFSDQA